MSDTEDALLVERCLQGDQLAFEQLVERHQKAVFNIAFRMASRFEDAQDIAQTVFLKAYQNLANFNGEHKFFSWIYRIAVNESINFVHRRKPQEFTEEMHRSPDLTPQEAMEASETEREIEAAMATLSAEYRAVIVLRHFEDLSYDEIARTLGISEKKVKSRLFSARRLLCEALSRRGVTTHD
jgi:RNA polymerase sigma-70 factor, ECF subfamily